MNPLGGQQPGGLWQAQKVEEEEEESNAFILVSPDQETWLRTGMRRLNIHTHIYIYIHTGSRHLKGWCALSIREGKGRAWKVREGEEGGGVTVLTVPWSPSPTLCGETLTCCRCCSCAAVFAGDPWRWSRRRWLEGGSPLGTAQTPRARAQACLPASLSRCVCSWPSQPARG